MQLVHNGVADAEPQSRSLTEGIALVEPFEDVTHHLFAHTATGILDENDSLMFCFISPVTDGDTAFGGKLTSVGNQVVKYLLEAIHVCTNYDAITFWAIHEQLQFR